MGIAAYYRGNQAITLQFNREAGIPDPCFVPDKRPADWGDKAQQRALECGRRIIAGAAGYGLAAPTEEVLAMAIKDRAKVGAKTAAEVARTILNPV